MRPLLDVREVARLLNCSVGSVYRGVLLKKIPALRVPGAGVRFVEEDLIKWLEEQRHKAEGRP